MRNKIFIRSFLLFILFSTEIVLFSSCKKKENGADMAGADEYYTCSMDPQVVENKPGNCPICHMKLIKVKKSNLHEGQIKLSKQQIKLANITFDTLGVHEIAKEITLTGKVTIDQNLSEAISSKIQGRIEKLLVKNLGSPIMKGQLLYEIYSEDLSVVQQEYIAAIQNQPTLEKFAEAAKNKLLLYGMNEEQIEKIRITKKVLQSVPIFSHLDGYVNEISVSEGNYVSTGTVLFRIVSLNSLWVETQVYLPYLPYIRKDTEATLVVPASGGKVFTGKVIFIDPQVQAPERFVLARFQITNPAAVLKPGLLVNITIQTEKIIALSVPVDAIIQNSIGTNVWVINSDGVFENKMVITGIQSSNHIEIKSGLNPGDVVVISGAYLLNSEYVFKKGVDPMAGHGHKHQDEQNMQSMPGMKM